MQNLAALEFSLWFDNDNDNVQRFKSGPDFELSPH